MRSSGRMIRSLEIAIDMLDRSEGTALYEVQKQVWGWTSKEYQDAIEDLGFLMLTLKVKKDKDGEI